MTHHYTGADIDRAITLGVHWQDHSPAELYLMAKAQQRENRRWAWLTGSCVALAAVTIAWGMI